MLCPEALKEQVCLHCRCCYGQCVGRIRAEDQSGASCEERRVLRSMLCSKIAPRLQTCLCRLLPQGSGMETT